MTAQLPLGTNAQRARLKARDFWLLADAGAFDGFAKSELIDGEIWVVNAVHVWHAKAFAYLTLEFGLGLRRSNSGLIVYGSGSVDFSEDDVPEPDISIGEDHDGKGLPHEKLRIAIEISDTTLARDLNRKVPLYANRGVPEYWIVDRDGRRIIQFWSPLNGSYQERRDIPFGDSVTAAIIPDLTIATDRL